MGIYDRDGNYVTAEDVLDDEELAEYYAHSNRTRPKRHMGQRPDPESRDQS